MYDITYKCTYNNAECSEQDIVYQKDMLGICGIKEFDDNTMNQCVEEIYEKIKDHPEFQDCMKKGSAKFLTEDLLTGLMVMFSFDFMYITHTCIKSVLTNDSELYETSIKKLKSKMEIL